MKVYVVSQGEYSANEDLFALRDEETANRFVRSFDGLSPWGNDYYVEEIDLLDESPVTIDVLQLRCRFVDATIEGEMESHRWLFPTLVNVSPQDKKPVNTSFDANRSRAGDKFSLFVYGTDHEQVRKVYSERKARTLAEWDVLVVKHFTVTPSQPQLTPAEALMMTAGAEIPADVQARMDAHWATTKLEDPDA